MSSSILTRAAERAAMYDILSLLWDSPPDADLLSGILALPDDTSLSGWTDLKAGCDEDPEELAVEFTRLFVGPKDHLPPFQSVWVERQLDGEAAVSMRKFGELLGVETATDNLASQLHCMVVLLKSTETESDTASLESLAASFFAGHLTWADDLLAAVTRRSQNRFYVALAILTRDFLASEHDLLAGSR